MWNPRLYRAVFFVAFGILYFLFARIGLSVELGPMPIAPFWPPTGLSLAGFILCGPWIWPGVLLGTLANNLYGGTNWGVTAFASVGNVLEAAGGYFFIKHYIEPKSLFLCLRGVFLFILTALFAPVISALFGAIAHYLFSSAPILNPSFRFFSWWIENCSGILVFTPVLVSWMVSPSGSAAAKPVTGKYILEFLFLIFLLGSVSGVVFAGWSMASTQNYAIEYLCLPFVIWAAFRFGIKGASASLVILSAFSILGTRAGLGPFASSNPLESTFLILVFLASNVLLYLFVCATNSERRNVEMKLERSNAELERFAYLASHDLQEPLRTVSGFCRLIERRYRGTLDSEADEYIELVVRAATHMHSLIHSLLSYSKVGKHFRPQWTESSEVLRNVMDNLQSELKISGAEIAISNLPSVYVDPEILGLVLQNMIANCIKFRSERRLKISIAVEEGSHEWIFRIADNGIGVHPEHADKIFRLFQRVTRKEFRYGGGIGLALCKKVVEAHGGRIGVHSRPNEGAEFYFTFPMAAGRRRGITFNLTHAEFGH